MQLKSFQNTRAQSRLVQYCTTVREPSIISLKNYLKKFSIINAFDYMEKNIKVNNTELRNDFKVVL